MATKKTAADRYGTRLDSIIDDQSLELDGGVNAALIFGEESVVILPRLLGWWSENPDEVRTAALNKLLAYLAKLRISNPPMCSNSAWRCSQATTHMFQQALRNCPPELRSEVEEYGQGEMTDDVPVLCSIYSQLVLIFSPVVWSFTEAFEAIAGRTLTEQLIFKAFDQGLWDWEGADAQLWFHLPDNATASTRLILAFVSAQLSHRFHLRDSVAREVAIALNSLLNQRDAKKRNAALDKFQQCIDVNGMVLDDDVQLLPSILQSLAGEVSWHTLMPSVSDTAFGPLFEWIVNGSGSTSSDGIVALASHRRTAQQLDASSVCTRLSFAYRLTSVYDSAATKDLKAAAVSPGLLKVLGPTTFFIQKYGWYKNDWLFEHIIEAIDPSTFTLQQAGVLFLHAMLSPCDEIDDTELRRLLYNECSDLYHALVEARDRRLEIARINPETSRLLLAELIEDSLSRPRQSRRGNARRRAAMATWSSEKDLIRYIHGWIGTELGSLIRRSKKQLCLTHATVDSLHSEGIANVAAQQVEDFPVDTPLVFAEELEELKASVDCLKNIDRQILRKLLVEQKPRKMVAQELSTTPSNISKHVKAINARLSKHRALLCASKNADLRRELIESIDLICGC